MAIPKKPATLHDRATRAYMALQKRIKTHGNSLDKLALEVIRDAMLEIKAKQKPKREKVRGIESLHRGLIMCINKTPLKTDHRDKAEVDAYRKKVKGVATSEEVAMLQEFYAVPAPKHFHDQLSKRRKDVVTIINHYREQVDLAEIYFSKNPRKGTKAKSAIPDAPHGWRNHALGAYQQDGYSSWQVYWQNYNAEAKEIIELTK